ncbi:MAG: hypothetical protein GSR86_08145 [Desulfurococcales archaeon]|nr:hypothetical protein [Desulfurococcales archaeon]
MSACRGLASIGCIGIAGAGLPILASLVGEAVYWISLAIIIITASLQAFTARSPRRYLLTVTILVVTIVAGFVDLRMMALAAITLILASIVSSGLPGLTSIMILPAALIVAGYNDPWVIRYATLAGVVVSIIYLYAATGRIHSLASVILLAPILYGGLELVLAAPLVLLLGLTASAGFIEKSGCPFKTENRVVIAGSAIAGIGLLVMLYTGWMLQVASLWLLGVLLLEAGVLAPKGSS